MYLKNFILVLLLAIVLSFSTVYAYDTSTAKNVFNIAFDAGKDGECSPKFDHTGGRRTVKVRTGSVIADDFASSEYLRVLKEGKLRNKKLRQDSKNGQTQPSKRQ